MRVTVEIGGNYLQLYCLDKVFLHYALSFSHTVCKYEKMILIICSIDQCSHKHASMFSQEKNNVFSDLTNIHVMKLNIKGTVLLKMKIESLSIHSHPGSMKKMNEKQLEHCFHTGCVETLN